MLPFYIIKRLPPLRKKLYSMYGNRADQIINKITPFIKKGDNILDIGCGTGAISRGLKAKKDCQVSLVDVQYNVMCDQYPVIIYNGNSLPFPDKHFSKTLLMAVLHHCQNPLSVLDEAIRVTSGEIIVMEDVFSDWRGRAITFVGDCLVNWEIHSPFKNHSSQNWIKIFQNKNLKVKHHQEFRLRCIGFPFKLAIYVLATNPKAEVSSVGH